MAHLHFTWDAAKARANITKHGISFEEAETAFADEDAILLPDPEHSLTEERFVLSGLNLYLRDCALTGRRPAMTWRPSRSGAA